MVKKRLLNLCVQSNNGSHSTECRTQYGWYSRGPHGLMTWIDDKDSVYIVSGVSKRARAAYFEHVLKFPIWLSMQKCACIKTWLLFSLFFSFYIPNMIDSLPAVTLDGIRYQTSSIPPLIAIKMFVRTPII